MSLAHLMLLTAMQQKSSVFSLSRVPTKATTPTTHAIVPFHVQGEAYHNFVQAHGELYNGIFAEQNATIIANWMRDNSRQCDAASLDQCFSECSRLGYFRDAACFDPWHGQRLSCRPLPITMLKFCLAPAAGCRRNQSATSRT